MALVIRMRQQGRCNHRTFRLVIMEKRAPRDGKYLEMLGHYDPCLDGDKGLVVKKERIEHWLSCGAMISEKAKSLVAKAAPEVIKKFDEQRRLKKEKLKKKTKKTETKTKKKTAKK